MRFARLGPRGAERPVLLHEDRCFDLSGLTPDIDGRFLAARGLDRSRRALADGTLPEVAGADELRVGAPIARPSAVICIGMNYAAHAAESGSAAPEVPIIFLKTPNTVVGPYDDVVIPRGSENTDWEVELGVVIGRTASYLETDEEALEHVAGYVLVNDVSERHFQLERGGQWDKGKNAPTFCPIGPWLLTADEVADPQAIKLGLDVNGDVVQDSSTAEMIFGVAYLVRYISQFMTLYPGDVISTGTPAGVGAGQKPPRYLKEGDVLRVWADGLGEQHTRLTSA
jgi:2-keto-4-pentenoate hydratase/2-oxohepta-3-ene-1,7-dioic acid hydratase in catechol pathway